MQVLSRLLHPHKAQPTRPAHLFSNHPHPAPIINFSSSYSSVHGRVCSVMLMMGQLHTWTRNRTIFVFTQFATKIFSESLLPPWSSTFSKGLYPSQSPTFSKGLSPPQSSTFSQGLFPPQSPTEGLKPLHEFLFLREPRPMTQNAHKKTHKCSETP